jgi:hypothetical protein
VDDASAYPLDLADIPLDSIIDYQSYPFFRHTGPVEGFLYFLDFLDGAAPAATASVDPEGVPLSPEAERSQEARARGDRYRELRRALP